MALPDRLPGDPGLLIPRTLRPAAPHGRAISERIQQVLDELLRNNQGSLCPALHRLSHRGWIEAGRAVSEVGRRATYDRLTPAGGRQLALEARGWARMSNANGRAMKGA